MTLKRKKARRKYRRNHGSSNTTMAAPHMFIKIDFNKFPVTSFAQASKMYRDAIHNYEKRAGAGAGHKIPHPLIVDGHGKTIAHVSYNGRVWPGHPGDYRPGETPLYDVKHNPRYRRSKRESKRRYRKNKR